MAELHVVSELHAFLIAQGVGVAPTAVDSAYVALPTVWDQPRGGPVQPRWSDALAGYQEDATISLFDPELASPANELDAYIEESFIDVTVRSRNRAAGKLIHRQIRGLITPIGSAFGRKLWMMNDLLVELSTPWRGEREAGETDIDFTRTASYRFQVRRKALAGLPYAP